jgi:hypothetical protein
MRSKIFILFVISIVCTLAASGCVITKVHTVPVEDFNVSYDNAWDGLLYYMNREKEPIVVSDKEKGLISTDWVIMEKVFSAKRYRYDIQINKLNESQVRIGIASPQEAYSMGDWESMLPSERRANRIFDFVKSWKGVTQTVSAANEVKVTSGIKERPFNKIRR